MIDNSFNQLFVNVHPSHSCKKPYFYNALRRFLQIWHKCSFGFVDKLIRSQFTKFHSHVKRIKRSDDISYPKGKRSASPAIIQLWSYFLQLGWMTETHRHEAVNLYYSVRWWRKMHVAIFPECKAVYLDPIQLIDAMRMRKEQPLKNQF